jgi:hypothetical protein
MLRVAKMSSLDGVTLKTLSSDTVVSQIHASLVTVHPVIDWQLSEARGKTSPSQLALK